MKKLNRPHTTPKTANAMQAGSGCGNGVCWN
jgi:hypothetical protein